MDEKLLIQFQERKKELIKLSKKIEKRLRRAPEGSLRISDSTNKKRKQYYWRISHEDKHGTYIKKDNINMAKRLAQKDYDRKMLISINKEIKAIDLYLNHFPETAPEEIYTSLNAARKNLVIPYYEPDQLYIERWKEVEYTGKEFRDEVPELYTDLGERVRSKSEVIIANTLHKYQIPYRYEYPIKLDRYGTVYPDFTILDIKERKEIYWEHQGMMDDQIYVEKAIRKIYYYTQNGIFQGDRLILTSETRSFPINIREIESIIEHYILHK